MMITEPLQILPGSYTITSTRSMPGQRLCNSWHRHWLSKQHACQSAQQATSGSVPVCTRSWSGCWMMQRSGTNWRAIWKCTSCHRPERDNRDQLHTSSTRNIPRPGDPHSSCTTTRLRSMPGETRRPEETQDDRAFALEETTCKQGEFRANSELPRTKLSQQVLSHMCEPACLVSSERTYCSA